MNQEKGSETASVESKKVMEEIAVLKANQRQNFANAFLSFFLAFMGGIAFVAEVALLKFPINNIFVFLAILFVFPITITIIAVLRNRILVRIFNSFSAYAYLRFAKFWRYYFFIVFITVVTTIVLAQIFYNNAFIVISPALIFGLFTPFYFIFEFSLTYEGEIRILFANLLLSLNHFKRRNIFWERIAGKIQGLLRTGNIDVSKDDLIYYFNLKLWETNDDITNQLRSIEAWLLDRQRSCCEPIRQIIPQVCFQPLKRRGFWNMNSTSGQVDVNKVLDVIKVVGSIVGSIIVIILAFYFHVIPT